MGITAFFMLHQEEPLYYHSDHLGSASWITDTNGQPVQHLQYLPFGESFVNQHTSGYEERFTFTGKEKDSESGFYYFGARYYDCDLSGLFLSVDPMAGKYPSLSPYAYCAWNPVKLVDPDGNWPWEPKHIRQAKRFARQNNGSLSIEVKPNGVKLANVGYVTSSEEFENIPTIKSFIPKGYCSRGTIKETSGLAKAELWMDEPSDGFLEFGAKALSSFVYSFFNEPVEAITGHTIGGSEVNYNEKTQATISSLFAGTGKLIGKGVGLIKANGNTGLEKYNDFVKQNGGRNGRTQKEMGDFYQRNKYNYNDFEYEKRVNSSTIWGISIGNKMKEE